MSGDPLTPTLQARDQEALVVADEAKASQAATDAETSALTLAQTRYKSIFPDLTNTATNTVDDKSTGVAFSGLVTYSALNHAAEKLAARVAAALDKYHADAGSAANDQPAVLVTSQSDLLTNDLLFRAIKTSVNQLSEFADAALKATDPETGQDAHPAKVEPPGGPSRPNAEKIMADASGIGSPASAAAAIVGSVAGSLALGPLGALAAAASAIPSIISAVSSTTTIQDQSEDISDLATSTSVVAALLDRTIGETQIDVVHEDFRLAPASSEVGKSCQELARKRLSLVHRQEVVQIAKNEGDLKVAEAQQVRDAAAAKAKNDVSTVDAAPADPGLTDQINQATRDSANAAAALTLIGAAVSSIDTFTVAVNTSAPGQRSPLAVASMSELLDVKGDSSLRYVLSIKGLGGQSEDYTKDRHVGVDTFTTLADASISFMLLDLSTKKIIGSGLVNGVSSVHGRLGHPPIGLIGPDAETAIADQGAEMSSAETADPSEGDPPRPHQGWRQRKNSAPPLPQQSWWRRIF